MAIKLLRTLAREQITGRRLHMDLTALIARVQRLLTSPATEWDAIAGEAADIPKIYVNYVGPLALAAGVVTGLAMLLWGLGLGYAVQFIIVYTVLTNALAPTFGATQDMGQAFKLAAYTPTAAWVGAVFNIIPVLGQIIAIAAALYSLYLLYVGLPKLMRPPEDKVIVYILSVIGVVIVVNIAARLIV
jgi:hypothetical protein